MKIRLDQIGDEPVRWDESVRVDPVELERGELVGLSTVSFRGQVEANASGHLLTARLEYEQELSCPRCLATSKVPVVSEIELMVVQEDQEPMAGEYALEEDDMSVLFVDGDVLDTEPVLIEQLQLNIPMRQLCREDCKGLCPNCGADRNSEECSCSEDVSDPRWGALDALRDELAD